MEKRHWYTHIIRNASTNILFKHRERDSLRPFSRILEWNLVSFVSKDRLNNPPPPCRRSLIFHSSPSSPSSLPSVATRNLGSSQYLICPSLRKVGPCSTKICMWRAASQHRPATKIQSSKFPSRIVAPTETCIFLFPSFSLSLSSFLKSYARPQRLSPLLSIVNFVNSTNNLTNGLSFLSFVGQKLDRLVAKYRFDGLNFRNYFIAVIVEIVETARIGSCKNLLNQFPKRKHSYGFLKIFQAILRTQKFGENLSVLAIFSTNPRTRRIQLY